MGVYDDLLRVQEHDTAADRLRHRRANLPEAEQLARVERETVDLEARLVTVAKPQGEVALRQKRLEDELTALEAKLKSNEARLYSGAITIPRELQGMQAEAEALRRRRGSLEEMILEAMTEREPLDETASGLRTDIEKRGAEATDLQEAIFHAQATIDDELAVEMEARAAAAANIPPDLIVLYEQLRSRLGGVGAARLVNGRCSGCHLSLPATELDRLRREPPDALLRCDQCGRVLVR